MKKAEFEYNWPLIGNTHITEFLEKIIANQRANGAYIFNGPDNLGKTTLTKHFAQILFCDNYKKELDKLPCNTCPSCKQFLAEIKNPEKNIEQDENNPAHGDFHIIKKDKDKKKITVEQVRELVKILSLTSFLNSYKIGVIKHAESLSQEAANALLKTLEEPRDKVIIILVTHNLELLPATIKSRSQILNFRPVTSDIIYDYLINNCGVTRSMANNFSRLCLGRPALAVKFHENKDFFNQYLERINIFLNFFEQDLNERIIAVNKLLNAKDNREEAGQAATRIIEIWLGIIRDWMLLEFGRNDLIQHQITEKEVKNIKSKLSLKQIINLFQVLKEADENINHNINPKLALTNIAISV
ncbi:ATP-binding protein [Patescibacteria group bacterium]